MIPLDQLRDPTVHSLVTAINQGDRNAFYGLFSDGATMSDDGTQRDLQAWTEREIFSANGHMDVESQTADGRSLIADYRNDTYGTMRTSWVLTVEDGKITQMATGQA
jgi:hypothetical protein